MSIENRYDKIYSEKESPFGDEPEKVVSDIIEQKHISAGTVLELGAGDGRNALFLAKQGLAVTALDTSQTGIDILDQRAKEKGLSIQTKVRDIRDLSSFEPDRHFDVFVSTYVLHHLSRQDALLLIKQMQERTNPKGLNVIVALTENSDFYRNNPNTDDFYLQENELRDLYTDAGWEILDYDPEVITLAANKNKKRPDGSPMVNIAAELIARKKEH